MTKFTLHAKVAKILNRRLPGESVAQSNSRICLERKLRLDEQAARWRMIERNDRRFGWSLRFAAAVLALLVIFPTRLHLDATEVTGFTTIFAISVGSCVRNIKAALTQE